MRATRWRAPGYGVPYQPAGGARWHFRIFLAAILMLMLSAGAAAQTVWSLEPEACIPDPASGREAPSPVGSFIVGADGKVFVGYPMRAMVRTFSAAGEPSRVFGPTQSGRTVLTDAAGMGIVGDTLYVVDHRAGRVALFRTNGRFLGWTDAAGLLEKERANIRPLRLLPDGSWLLIATSGDATTRAEAGERSTEPFTAILRLPVGGSAPDTILRVPGRRTRPTAQVGGHSFNLPPTFADDPLLAASPAGDLLATVERTTPGGPEPTTFRVTAIRPNGDTIFSRTFEYDPLPLPRAVVDSIVAGEADHLHFGGQIGGANEQVREAVRRAWNPPAWQTPVTSAIVASDGSIWLRREALGTDVVNWMVISPNGEPVATLRTEALSRIGWIEDDHVWSLERNMGGVCAIRRYRAIR